MSVSATSCTTSETAAVPTNGTNQRLPASAAAALPAFTVMLIAPRLTVSERPRLREQRPDRAGYVMAKARDAIV
jgi:hypothetical protein